MAWEWRMFWQVSKEEKNILHLLNGVQLPHRPSEKRTDLYIPCTNEVGIKWRAGRQLEIKVKSEEDANNGAEKWDKILVTASPVHYSNHFVITQLDKLIRGGRYKIQLEQAKMALMTTPTLQFRELYKERSHTYTNSCFIEQTKFTSPACPGLTYQTIAIEGNKMNIDKFLTTPTANARRTAYEILREHGQLICGYPEFVLTRLSPL